jgi:hypothetical protein
MSGRKYAKARERARQDRFRRKVRIIAVDFGRDGMLGPCEIGIEEFNDGWAVCIREDQRDVWAPVSDPSVRPANENTAVALGLEGLAKVIGGK